MQTPRSRERIPVDIAITITTVLDSLEGTIVDLSAGGAQVVGCSLPTGSQCQLDIDGYSVFGTVRWSEEDRMGIRIPYILTEGPLFEQLEMARLARRAPVAFQPRPAAPAFTYSGPMGFGRRTS